MIIGIVPDCFCFKLLDLFFVDFCNLAEVGNESDRTVEVRTVVEEYRFIVLVDRFFCAWLAASSIARIGHNRHRHAQYACILVQYIKARCLATTLQ
jgi:hypothetical protein